MLFVCSVLFCVILVGIVLMWLMKFVMNGDVGCW